MTDQPLDQGELFPSAAGAPPSLPLATRMRPKRFEDLVGQRKVVDVLRELTRSGHLPSIVLWGPPGSGKTTLAGQRGRGLEAVQRHARVAARDLEERVHRRLIDGRVQLSEPALDHTLQLLAIQRLEPEDAAA